MNNIELLELDTLNLKCFRFRGPHSTCSGSSGSGSWRLGKKNRHSDRRTGKLSQIETRSAKCKPQVPQVPQVPQLAQLAQLAQVAPAPWSFPSFASFSFSGPCKHASTPLMSLMDVWWSSEVAFPRPDSSSFSLWQILKIFIWSSSICMKPFGKVLSQDATCHTRCLRCLQMPSDAFRCLQMPSVLILSGLNNSFHCSVVCLIFACKADRVVAESWREVTKGLVTTIQNDPTDPESGKWKHCLNFPLVLCNDMEW